MIVLRLLGWLLLAAAAVALAADIQQWRAGEAFHLAALGELWFRLDRAGLNLVQAVIQRYVWPPLWDPAILDLLLLPAAPAVAILGAILLLVARRRRRRVGLRS